MRRALSGGALLAACVLSSCGDDDAAPGATASEDGGSTGLADATSDGSSASDAASPSDGSTPAPFDGAVLPPPTPAAVCPTINPAGTAGATVVGDGTPASCTQSALAAALAQGGAITFSCGASPHTIEITSTLAVSKAKDTVLDGGGKITLDGKGTTRIMKLDRADFPKADPKLTVQNLTFKAGRGAPTSGGSTDDGSGGAIYLPSGGSLTVVGSTFVDNDAPSPGQEIGGGAIFVNGAGDVVVSGSSFSGNAASNGGAIGIRGASLLVVGTVFNQNAASGTGGNPGNGGNGGAVVIDGQGKTVRFCSTRFVGNTAGAHGGAIFRTGYQTETNTIERSVFHQNTSVEGGSALYLQGVAVVLTESSVTGSSGGGAIFLANHGNVPETAKLVNVTIANNDVGTGLGAGISDIGITSGSLEHVTMVGNKGQFDVAIHGGKNFTIKNSIISGQVGTNVANPNNPLSCGRFEGGSFNHPMASAAPAANLQWPKAKGGGFDDNPCATGITFANPMLGSVSETNGTFVAVPQAGSPAKGVAQSCPSVDQLGNPRPASGCTAGAVE